MTAAQSPVTVYYTTTCPWCDRVKDYLKKNNVDFVEKDVATDYDAAMEMIKRSGQQGVPVIATDKDVIVGFDQARLAKVVAEYAKAKRPPLGLLAADAEQYFEKHPEIRANYPDGAKGIFVGDVRPKSVAERSGLRFGDIVTSVAGKKVKNMSGLDQMIDTLNPGDKVSVRFLRGQNSETGEFQF